MLRRVNNFQLLAAVTAVLCQLFLFIDIYQFFEYQRNRYPGGVRDLAKGRDGQTHNPAEEVYDVDLRKLVCKQPIVLHA